MFGLGTSLKLRAKRSIQRLRHRQAQAVPHRLPGPLVVSLTSYKPRFQTLDLTLCCLLSQSARADMTVLWVASDDMPFLPKKVKRLQEYGLTIRDYTDIGSYKKIIPALRAFPDAFIVTADDDLEYPSNWLHHLVANYRSNDEVICRRAHRVRVSGAGLAPYSAWDMNIAEESSGPLVFPTGGAGALYPPHILPLEALNEDEFLRLCPHADDVWLYWMASLAGRMFRRVGPPFTMKSWPRSQESALYSHNVQDGGNDRQIAALRDEFGLPPSLADIAAGMEPPAPLRREASLASGDIASLRHNETGSQIPRCGEQ